MSIKFAPATSPSVRSPVADGYTTSPQSRNEALRRSGTVADRINEKLRAASVTKSPPLRNHKPKLSIDGKMLPPPRTAESPDEGSPTKEDTFIPPTEPNGQPTIHQSSPPVPQKDNPTSPLTNGSTPPVLLSGLSLSTQNLQDLFRRFDAYLLSTPSPDSDAPSSSSSSRSNAALSSRHRTTILGAYEKTFSGEEAVDWLKENVEGLGGDWERCEQAASELYKMGHIGRAGVGRGFESSYDTFFVLKQGTSQSTQSGILPMSPSTSANLQSMLKSYLPGSLASSDEPAHLRLRKEATKADEAYKEGVRSAEEKRLEMEERIEKGLRVWERWERERLAVVKAGKSLACIAFPYTNPKQCSSNMKKLSAVSLLVYPIFRSPLLSPSKPSTRKLMSKR